MKRGLLFLLIFSLTIASVSAVEVSYSLVQDEALPGNEVTYNIHVNNNEGSTLLVNFRAADLNWLLTSGEGRITVEPGQTKDRMVTFTPLSRERIPPGNYGIRLVVSTQLTTLEKILPAKVWNYNQVLDSNFESTPIIDPRRGAILRLNVNNIHKVNLEDLNLELSSSHFQFTKQLGLGKEESTLLEFPVRLDPDTLRGDYSANVKVMMGDNLLLDKQISYTIQEYENINEVKVPQAGFLLGGETITETNEGNTIVTQTISRTFGWFSYKFASFDPQPSRIEKTDEGTIVSWDVPLSPRESATVSYVINYRVPVIILILIIAALAVWYAVRQRNAIVVVKRVFAMHGETGSVRIMKVLINVRNRGSVSVHNVRIVDKVPSAVKAPTQHGVLRPSHVKAVPEGTVMVWDLPAVRPGEEKIISYRIEGNITVMGRLMLPPAVAKYVLFGRGVAARSMSVSLREKK